jgi:hypothetical protein
MSNGELFILGILCMGLGGIIVKLQFIIGILDPKKDSVGETLAGLVVVIIGAAFFAVSFWRLLG